MTLPVMAYEYPYLTFTTADGVDTSVTVSNLKIVYSDGQLVATYAGGTHSFPLSNMAKMCFATAPSGVDKVVTGQDASLPVQVFNVAGAQVETYDNTPQALNQLEQGVYIFRNSSRTFKVVVP